YDQAQLQDYLNNLGQSMAKLSHRPNLQWQFKLLDSPVINAFAVPGGFIYLTRGILAYLNNEAELAGVIGHEIGHVTARHSAKTYSKAMLAQLGIEVGGLLSDTFREYAGIAQFGVGMLFLKFSRDDERQADALGVEYSAKAGYDADYMANFFNTLERLYPESAQSGLPAWFSTHPNPPDRIKAIQSDAQQWKNKLPQKKLAVNQDQYLSKLNGIIFGEDPRQGYVENNVFYHPQMKFLFPVPSKWKLNNTPSQVQMFTEEQDAVVLFSLAKASSPTAAADDFISNSGAAVKNRQSLRVNGLQAYSVTSDITSEGTTFPVISYFIQLDNQVFTFHGYSSPDKFSGYLPALTTAMKGFKRLTDRSKINVKPSRLIIRKTSRSQTLRAALNEFGVAPDKLEDIAILNGRQLDDTVAANTMFKLVEK
ncbi:MAG: M48 family metalloprotease, partial [bacterium]|nr:M48 family metalloprotease [bacterium]